MRDRDFYPQCGLYRKPTRYHRSDRSLDKVDIHVAVRGQVPMIQTAQNTVEVPVTQRVQRTLEIPQLQFSDKIKYQLLSADADTGEVQLLNGVARRSRTFPFSRSWRSMSPLKMTMRRWRKFRQRQRWKQSELILLELP